MKTINAIILNKNTCACIKKAEDKIFSFSVLEMGLEPIRPLLTTGF